MLHTLIIWPNAMHKEQFILNDLKKSFKIKRLFHMNWTKDEFMKNLYVFYASMDAAEMDTSKYQNMITNKVNVNGTGRFTVAVVEDSNPKIEHTKTVGGECDANTNIYSKKKYYRSLTQPGYKVHSSNNTQETTRDLLSLFNLTVDEFMKKYPGYDDTPIEYTAKSRGAKGGFDTIYDFFKTLNNNIRYCVLRGFEELPDKYPVDGGDIDILVEDKRFFKYLTNGRKVHPEAYRIQYEVNVAGRPVKIDVRNVGDDYYCKKWEKDMLARRMFWNGIYVPSGEDYKYSLLYHCLLQKNRIDKKYDPVFKALDLYGDKDELLDRLSRFMVSHLYEYVVPTDIKVFSNTENIKALTGKKVKKLGGILNGVRYAFIDDVHERKDSYIKYGISMVIDNEYDILRHLKGVHFPKVFAYGTDGKFSKFEMKRIKGVGLDKLKNSPNFLNQNGDKIFNRLLDILILLLTNNVIHRDIIGHNILIDTNTLTVGLIDFGWGEYIDNMDNGLHPTPEKKYRPDDGFSDPYAMGVVIDEIFGDRYKEKTDVLRTIRHKDYADPEKIKDKIRTLYI